MHRLVIAAVVAMAAIFTAIQLSRTGYCFGERRWLSEREKIEAATSIALRGGDAWYSVQRTRPNDEEMTFRSPPYTSAAEFLAAHSDCCRIGADYHGEVPPISRGEAGTTNVMVDFRVRAATLDGSEQPITVRTNITVDGCGRRYDSYGFFRVGRTSWQD